MQLGQRVVGRGETSVQHRLYCFVVKGTGTAQVSFAQYDGPSRQRGVRPPRIVTVIPLSGLAGTGNLTMRAASSRLPKTKSEINKSPFANRQHRVG